MPQLRMLEISRTIPLAQPIIKRTLLSVDGRAPSRNAMCQEVCDHERTLCPVAGHVGDEGEVDFEIPLVMPQGLEVVPF